jgi:signal transduction histidine kinase/ligand-binding sensor domain-containing protein
MYSDGKGKAIKFVSIQQLFIVMFVNAILCISAFGLNPDRLLSQYAHTTWRTSDGFFNSAPTAITQTSDGYIWIGTQSGLVRFDGVRFVPWTPPVGNQLPSSNITSLLSARDGSLWIGTMRGPVHWKNGELTTYPNIAGFVDFFLEDRRGLVWMARTRVHDKMGPVCRMTDTKAQCYGVADGVAEGNAAALAEDPQGGFWIGGTLLQRWRAGSSEIYRPFALKATEKLHGIEALVTTTDGSLWAGMAVEGPGLGLQKLLDGVWKPFVTPAFDSSTLNVNTLKPTQNNGLLIGTDSHGLYRISNGKVDHFQATDGLTGDSVRSFDEDREGNLWVATSEGVDRFSDRAVVTFSMRQGLGADDVQSVFASPDGSIRIGNQQGLDLLGRDKITSIRKKNGFPGSGVTSLFEERPGSLWLGIDNGLWIYEKGVFSSIKRLDGGPVGAVLAMTKDVDGSMWVELVGSPAKLLHIRNRTIQEEVVVSQDFFEPTLVADPLGGVWLSLVDGKLAHYRNGNIEIVHPTELPNTRPLNHIIFDTQRWLLGTTSRGLVGLRNGRIQKLTQLNGLPCSRLYNLIEDGHGSLWIYAECGLIEISHEEMQQWRKYPETKVGVRIFDAFDGAQPGSSPFGPSAAMSPDGRLWFANYVSLQMINPAELKRNTVQPPVHIEEVIADRKSYAPQQGLHLPSLLRDLEIDYTALSFVNPKKVLFRYKLEGHDSDWQEPGVRRQALYNDLRPGRYRFHVIACNNDGVWNETGDALNFFIAPTFYQTSWFRALCVVAAIGLLQLFYLLRLKLATSQIQERLGARLEERERIARELHDTLLQGFQGLMLRFQAVLNALPNHEPAYQTMAKALDKADEILLEGRQSVRDLREENTCGGELSEMIAHCGQELTQDYPSLFDLAVVGTPQVFNTIVFDEVYRIAREALINAFQHAQATKIEVELTYGNILFCLKIRDDGKGIDAEVLTKGKTGHWGLSGMRERAHKIGSQLNIWSNSGAGTEIELTIPAEVAYRDGEKESLWRRIKRLVKKPLEV